MIRCTLLLFSLACLSVKWDAAAQAVIYVDADATGANNGISWADAFTDLQDGLASAIADDELWVAEGTYRPTSGSDRAVSFALASGVRVFGGFDGTESMRHQRNWAEHETVLSGDIGVQGSAGDNSYHVVVASGVDRTALLDGFMVELGNANGNSEPLGDAGGGIFMQSGGPTIQNVIIRNNFAPNGAGVMARDGSTPLFTNDLFYGNLAGSGGGAAANVNGGNATYVNCTFSANIGIVGAGLYISGSYVAIDNSILWGDLSDEIATVSGGVAQVNYAIVEGGYAGSVVLDADPQFTAPQADDFRLESNSPAIDIGSGTLLPADVFDLDGDGDTSESIPYDLLANNRSRGAQVDLGGFEWNAEFCPAGSRLYVDHDAAGGGTGDTWLDAFASLSQALAIGAKCPSVGEVWVAEGIYQPSTSAPEISFGLRNNLAIYGGFDGSEIVLDERDWRLNQTILTGDDFSRHVFSIDGVDETAILDGFFIVESAYGGIIVTSGNPTLRFLEFAGHGYPHHAITVEGGSPALEDIVFLNNDGGVLIEGGSPTFTRCRFSDNTTFPSPAFDIVDGSPTIFDSEFSDNSHFGVRASGGTLRIENSLFDDNYEGVTAIGGSITIVGSLITGHNEAGVNMSSGVLTMIETDIVRNHDSGIRAFGAGLRMSGGAAVFLNTSFLANSLRGTDKFGVGSAQGAGAYIEGGEASFMNCRFVNNVATAVGKFGGWVNGAGLDVGDASVSVINTVFTGNTASAGTVNGAAIYSGGALLLANSIIWGNEMPPGQDPAELFILDPSTSVVANSIIARGYKDGTNILDLDPLFVEPAVPGDSVLYGDLHLQAESPAVDFGEISFLPPDSYDLDGDGDTTEPLPIDLDGIMRIQGASVDLGPYESPFVVAIEPDVALPATFALRGAYPNPFNPITRIAFDLPRAAEVALEVFDVLGRRVAESDRRQIAAGVNRSIELDGRMLASGLYLYRISAEFGGEVVRASGRVTLLK